VRIFWPRLDREDVLRRLREGIPALAQQLPLVRVVLFGSYAKGNYAVGSDVDVVIVYRGERREDAYAIARRALALPGLEPHLYAEAEYATVKDTVDRMCLGGVVLYPEETAT